MPAEDDVLDALRGAAADLRAALVDLESTALAVQRLRRRGVPFSQIYNDLHIRDLRDRVFERLTTFERAFNATRSLGVRMLVDEEGMTLTQVAHLMHRSRQFVTRLYRAPVAKSGA